MAHEYEFGILACMSRAFLLFLASLHTCAMVSICLLHPEQNCLTCLCLQLVCCRQCRDSTPPAWRMGRYSQWARQVCLSLHGHEPCVQNPCTLQCIPDSSSAGICLQELPHLHRTLADACTFLAALQRHGHAAPTPET